MIFSAKCLRKRKLGAKYGRRLFVRQPIKHWFTTAHFCGDFCEAYINWNPCTVEKFYLVDIDLAENLYLKDTL